MDNIKKVINRDGTCSWALALNKVYSDVLLEDLGYECPIGLHDKFGYIMDGMRMYAVRSVGRHSVRILRQIK